MTDASSVSAIDPRNQPSGQAVAKLLPMVYRALPGTPNGWLHHQSDQCRCCSTTILLLGERAHTLALLERSLEEPETEIALAFQEIAAHEQYHAHLRHLMRLLFRSVSSTWPPPSRIAIASRSMPVEPS